MASICLSQFLIRDYDWDLIEKIVLGTTATLFVFNFAFMFWALAVRCKDGMRKKAIEKRSQA